jgi:YVTN family beta-propeller protein
MVLTAGQEITKRLPVTSAPRRSGSWVRVILMLLGLQAASIPVFGAALAYVVNNSSNTVTVFDLQSHSTVGTIPVGASPTEIRFAPDNRVAYVTNEGSNSVSVIHLTSQTVTATIPVGISPSAIVLSLNGRYGYVVNTGSDNLTVLDTSNNTVLTTIPLGTTPVSIRITDDGLYLFIANQDANSVTVVSTADLSVVATIPVGSAPNLVGLAPDNRQACSVNTGSNNVTVIDTQNLSVVRTIPVGTNPVGLAFSVDGQFAYVTNRGSNTVSQINLAQGVVTRTFNVGIGPVGIALSDDGRVAYVSNSGANNVTVLDTQNPANSDSVVVGQSPFDIQFDPTESFVYVTNRSSGSVSVITTNTNTLATTVTVGSSPVQFAFLNAPTILAISQDQGGSSGGTSLQIIGRGFVDGVTVDFGGSAATVNEFSPFALRVTTNAHNPGMVDVTVVNPDQSSDSLPLAFTFQGGSLNYQILFPSSADNSAFRTNLGLNSLLGSATTATVSLVGPSGNIIGSQSYPLPLKGLQQINNINRDLGGTNTSGSLQITANAPISGFASIIDNSSQDPSIEMAGQRGDVRLLIPSVTNVGAFRSNVVIRNLSAFPASVNLTARDTNGIRITVPRVLSIPSGGTFESNDILTFLGASERSGPLEIESINGASLVATSRVYSDSPLGGTNGGFFEGQSPNQAAPALFVPFVSDTAEFRTNLGLNNPGNAPATVTVLFLNSMGELQASGTTTVPVSGMTQINAIVRKLLNNPAKADLQLVPDSATADREGYLQIISSQPLIVWASQIDNMTNDPSIEVGRPVGFVKLWLPSSTNTGFFRSTLSLLNTESTEAKVDILARGTDGRVQGMRSVVVPPNGLFFETDILSSLDLSETFGPLEINVANGLPVIAISRVYSTNGTSGFFESHPID